MQTPETFTQANDPARKSDDKNRLGIQEPAQRAKGQQGENPDVGTDVLKGQYAKGQNQAQRQTQQGQARISGAINEKEDIKPEGDDKEKTGDFYCAHSLNPFYMKFALCAICEICAILGFKHVFCPVD